MHSRHRGLRPTLRTRVAVVDTSSWTCSHSVTGQSRAGRGGSGGATAGPSASLLEPMSERKGGQARRQGRTPTPRFK